MPPKTIKNNRSKTETNNKAKDKKNKIQHTDNNSPSISKLEILTMIVTVSDKKYEGRIQQHAFLVQQKARILLAFTATIFLLCIENVKAFTAPLSNPDTLFFMASGAHSIAKRWKSKSSTLTIRQTTLSKRTVDSKEEQCQEVRSNQILNRSQRKSSTSLRMAFSFSSLATKEDIPTLDMKTSINAFGSWYNKMDPVARPPDYDE